VFELVCYSSSPGRNDLLFDESSLRAMTKTLVQDFGMHSDLVNRWKVADIEQPEKLLKKPLNGFDHKLNETLITIERIIYGKFECLMR